MGPARRAKAGPHRRGLDRAACSALLHGGSVCDASEIGRSSRASSQEQSGRDGCASARVSRFLDQRVAGRSPEALSIRPRQPRSQSKDQFQKSFCDLDAQQADRILRPLLVARPWPEDLPSDPLQKLHRPGARRPQDSHHEFARVGGRLGKVGASLHSRVSRQRLLLASPSIQSAKDK